MMLVMQQISAGWTTCNLEDCVEILDSLRKPVNNDERQGRIAGKSENQLFPYYGATGQVGYIDDYLFDGEFVALGEDGVPFFDPQKHKAYLLKGKTWVNNHAHVIRGASNIDNRFLCYQLNQIDYHGYVNGATRLKLTQLSMRRLPILLPPVNEQIRIADKLDSVLAKVDAAQARLEKIPTLLKRFRQSVLAAATSGELTREWREQTPVDNLSESELKSNIENEWFSSKQREFIRKNKFPKSLSWRDKVIDPNIEKSEIDTWFSLTLESVAEIIDPNPSHRMPNYVEDGVSFISSENIAGNDEIDFTVGKRITNDELKKQKERYEITNNSFAFTRIGTIGKSVKLALPHNYGISHAMAVVTPFDNLVNGKFLRLIMSCISILKQASDGVQSVGVPDLGIGKMKNFRIPFPPVAEQKEIVRRVESLFALADAVEKQYLAAKQRLDRLTQSLLAKAFRGELVPQDPNDESAAELLKRIQAERQAQAPAKRNRKQSA